MTIRKPGLGNNRRGVFFDWYVVAAMFFTTFAVVGAGMGCGVFVPALEKDFVAGVGFLLIAGLLSFAIRERRYSVRHQPRPAQPRTTASTGLLAVADGD